MPAAPFPSQDNAAACDWGCYLLRYPDLQQAFHGEDALQKHGWWGRSEVGLGEKERGQRARTWARRHWAEHGRHEKRDCTCEDGRSGARTPTNKDAVMRGLEEDNTLLRTALVRAEARAKLQTEGRQRAQSLSLARENVSVQRPVTALLHGLGVSNQPANPNKKKNIVIVAVMKGEVLYLKEWIVYHSLVGVDHFYLYCNDNVEDVPAVRAVLDPYIALGRVTMEDWAGRVSPVQEQAYAHWKETYSRSTRWVCFLDLDEYITLMQTGTTLPDMLKRLDKNVAGLAVHWRMFGSSGLLTRAPGSVMTTFLLCNSFHDSVNRHVKTIVRSQSLARMLVHDAKLIPGRGVMQDTSGNRLPSIYSLVNISTTQSSDVGIRINHYHVKSKEEFRAKIHRGRATKPFKRDEDYFAHHLSVFNDELSLDIVRWVQAQTTVANDGDDDHHQGKNHRVRDREWLEEARAILLHDGRGQLM